MSNSNMTEIVIPVPSEQLGLFIAGLLGQRRRIVRRFRCDVLAIRFIDITSVVAALYQRFSQNQCSVIKFNAEFFYEGGRSINVHSFQAFNSYTDNTNAISVGVDIDISLLIKFPTRDLPEKQDINLTILSDDRVRYYIHVTDDSFKIANLSYVIESTDLTWAEDLSVLMETQVRSLLFQDRFSKVRSWLRNPSYAIGFLASAFVFGVLAYFYSRNGIAHQYDILDDYIKKIPNVVTPESDAQKIEAILNYVTLNSGVYSLSAARASVFAFSGFLIVLSISAIAKYGTIAIVAVNGYTERKLDKEKTFRNNIKWAVLVSLIVGVAASVLANHVDAFLTRIFQ